MYSPALTFPSTASCPENVSLMQDYLPLLFAVTVRVLATSSTAISAGRALLISVEFYLAFIQTQETKSSFSPCVFIGLDLYFWTWKDSPKVSYELLSSERLFECWSNKKTCTRGAMHLPTVLGGLGHYFAVFFIKGMINLSRYLAISVSQSPRKDTLVMVWPPQCTLQTARREFPHFTLSFLSLPAFSLGAAQAVTVALITLSREPSFPSFQPSLTPESFTCTFWSRFYYDDFLRCLLPLTSRSAQTVPPLLSITMQPLSHHIHCLPTLPQETHPAKWEKENIILNFKEMEKISTDESHVFATVFVFH